MHVSVNGVRLFFDVEGAKLIPDGPVMREKPVLLMLHGGPGADHSIYQPAYSALADIAQIVYLDHRGKAAARTARASAGIWRSGATTSMPSAKRSASWIRSCSAPRSAAWWRCPTPPAIPPTFRS